MDQKTTEQRSQKEIRDPSLGIEASPCPVSKSSSRLGVAGESAPSLKNMTGEQITAVTLNEELHDLLQKAESRLSVNPESRETRLHTQSIKSDLEIVADGYYKSLTDWSKALKKQGEDESSVQQWINQAPKRRQTALLKVTVDRVTAKLQFSMEANESTSTERPAVHETSERSGGATRLPPLPSPTLPIFNGNHLDFSAWWECFREMIDARRDISLAEKMAYLRASVTDTAKIAISQISASGDAYADAIKLLKQSFGANKAEERLVLTQLEGIKAANDSWSSQLTMVLSLKGAVANLSRSRPELQRDLTLQQMLLRKFPSETQDNLLKFIYKTDDVNVSSLLDQAEVLIKEEIFIAQMKTGQIQQRVSKYTCHIANPEIPDNKFQRQSTTVRTESQLESETRCIFCSKHKLSWECRKIPLVKERVDFIRSKGWCIACLRPGGTVHQCHKRCPFCDGPHDLALCFKLVIEKSGSKRNRNLSKRREHNEGNRSDARNHERRPENRKIVRSSEPNGGNFPNSTRSPQSQHIGQMHSILPQEEIFLETRLQTGKLIVAGCFRKKVDFILDTGASMSLVSEEVAKNMKLKRVRRTFSNLCGLGGVSAGRKEYTIYEVPLESTDGSIINVEAMGHSEPITTTLKYNALPQQDISFIKGKNYRLADEYFSSSTTNPVILLGIKECFKVLHLAKKPIKLPSGYILMSSIFGWIAAGEPTLSALNFNRQQVVNHVSERKELEKEVSKAVERFLAIDEVVKGQTEEEKSSVEDSNVVDEYFKKNVSVRNNRVFTRYCMKQDLLHKLSENRNSSVARLRNVVNNLRTKGLIDHYHGMIMDHLEKKKIEIAQDPSTSSSVAYLPHHPVIRVDKETKPIRIVFDASAKERGKLSLNECMYTGEVNLERIPALLIRARTSSSILLCDVEAAFLQIGIEKDQRDWIRFIWLKDPWKPVRDSNLVHYRFTVAPFGIAQSPYLLESSIKYHVRKEESRLQKGDSQKTFVMEQLKHNLYVDNVLFECDESTDKRTLYATAKRFFAGISMNLREFASDSTEFIKSLPEEDRGKIGKQKILGVPWTSTTDTISIKATIPQVDGTLTKRKVLKKLASSFDPLGLLTVVLLPAKLFVQKLWTKDYGWDTCLDEGDTAAWQKIEEEISKFEFEIPRRIHMEEGLCTLIAFADASAKAMGAAVYLVNEKGGTLLIARSQLAPVRNVQTIPRLELKALLLASRLLLFTVRSILRTQPLSTVSCALFTDSVIALYWVEDRIKDKNSNRTKQNLSKEIANTRLQICEASHRNCGNPVKCVKLGHVRTEENPADFATRGSLSDKLQSNHHIWWSGPKWLTTSNLDNMKGWDPNTVNEEIKGEANEQAAPHPILQVSRPPEVDMVIDLSRFSSFNRAKRTFSHVRRFLRMRFKKLSEENRKRLKKVIGEGPTYGVITARELADSEIELVKMYQRLHRESIQCSGNKNLALFEDAEGLFRCGNKRLANSTLSFDEKYPIFLPGRRDNAFISLIIRHVHIAVKHAGENHTLDQLRSRYWIVRARRAVQYTLRKCVSCRKAVARPFKYPEAPDLPQERVSPSRPFKHIGLDFSGPFTVRDGAEVQKVYVLLLTCLATRAVHLEVTESLSATAFLMAFKRFVARRGAPGYVLSDNAPSFKATSGLLGESNGCESELFSSYCATKGVAWKFTAPHAPWQGGVYERLVGIMKSCMRKTFGRKVLNKDEFTTSVTEIEAVMNSRPLTHLSNEVSDSVRVLRPSDFLTPGASLAIFSPNSLNSSDYTPSESTGQKLLIHHSEMEIRLQKCWEIFLSDYLHALGGKSEATVSQGARTIRNPVVGEVVLLKEENTPRGSWPMGRVTSLSERAATVRTSSGRIVSRPLNLLIPLEIQSRDEEQEIPKNRSVEGDKKNPGKDRVRPLRECKSLARDPSFWAALR